MATKTGVPVLVALMLTLLAAGVAAAPAAQPNLPEPRPIVADPNTTALLVLDMSTRCDVPGAVCGELGPVIASFLPKARAAHVFTVYTVSASARGTELGEVWPGFHPQDDEVVIYPEGIDTVIVTGSSSNQAVLYTASGATRNNGFRAIIPMDGSNANSYYEWEYTMHKLNNVSFANLFSFTTLDLLTFGVGP